LARLLDAALEKGNGIPPPGAGKLFPLLYLPGPAWTDAGAPFTPTAINATIR